MRSDLRLPGAIADAASCSREAGQTSKVRVPVRANNAKRLVEVEHELRALGNGLEPRATARRILELLNERDRLLGSYARTCVECGEPFTTKRAQAQYCGDRCRQRSCRRVTDRVTEPESVASGLRRSSVGRGNGVGSDLGLADVQDEPT